MRAGGGEKPVSAAGREKGTAADPDTVWAVDLHLHTSASHDCMSPPERVVRRARAAGLQRIAVTDHNEIHGALAAREADPELVVVGEEVLTEEGLDLIGLFLEERIPPGAPFLEVAESIRDQGGVVYLPHPFDRYRGTNESFLDGVWEAVDVVEGFNARVHDDARNQRARAWAAKHALPVGGGSDAHLLREIGRGRTYVTPFHGPASFREAVEGARIGGRTSGRWVHLGSTGARLWKRILGR